MTSKKNVLKDQAGEVISANTEVPAVLATVAPAGALAKGHNYGDDAGAGFEHLTKGEILIPWCVLFQANSPQVEEKQIPGAEAGMLFNSASNELIDAEGSPYEQKGLLIQPVYTQRIFVEWRPRAKGGGVAGRYELTDPHVQAAIKANGGSEIFTKEKPMTGKVESVNNIVDTRYFYFNVLTPDGRDVECQMVMACSSSKIKPLSQLLNAVKNAKNGPPLFAARCYLTTFQDRQKAPPNKLFKNIRFTAADLRLDVDPKQRVERFTDTTLLDPENPNDRDVYYAGRDFQSKLREGSIKADFNAEAAANAAGASEDAVENKHF